MTVCGDSDGRVCFGDNCISEVVVVEVTVVEETVVVVEVTVVTCAPVLVFFGEALNLCWGEETPGLEPWLSSFLLLLLQLASRTESEELRGNDGAFVVDCTLRLGMTCERLVCTLDSVAS